jgi:hypothetical protein
MGFTAARFHYSLFLKNRLNKTPNWSPDQSLIAAFRNRNPNCIFLKILLARMPLFFMSALVLNQNELYTDLLQIFMGVFTGSRKLLTSRIQLLKIMKIEKNPLQIFENCGRETWYQFSLAWERNKVYSIPGFLEPRVPGFLFLKQLESWSPESWFPGI